MFLLEVRNWQSRSSNLRNNFRKMFLWTRNLQFVERSRRILSFSENFISQSLKKIIFFKQYSFSQWTFSVLWTEIRLLCWTFLPNDQSVFAQTPIKFEENTFFLKFFYLSRHSPSLIESSLNKTSDIFRKKSESDKMGQKTSQKASQNVLGARNVQFRKGTRKIFANVRAFSAQNLKEFVFL